MSTLNYGITIKPHIYEYELSGIFGDKPGKYTKQTGCSLEMVVDIGGLKKQEAKTFHEDLITFLENWRR